MNPSNRPDPTKEYITVSQSESDLHKPSRQKKSYFSRFYGSFTLIPYILGAIFSIYMLFTVFEVNIQSLRISSDRITANITAPAKRAVVIVSDGQRADVTYGTFQRKYFISPNFRTIVEKEGTYGISQATLPTESKICITSLLSGSYMDLPDLFNIYFRNQAIADNVLNESNYAWTFGNPEIIELYINTVDGKDTLTTTKQDYRYRRGITCPQSERMVDKIQDLLKAAETDKKLSERLKSDGVVIFLHITCTDDTGHKFGSRSREYVKAAMSTDLLMTKLRFRLDSFFGDQKTAYIFTSDHGMIDNGVHADDNPLNRHTPFIAWGAGISKPKVYQQNVQQDFMNFGFPNIKRRDLRQIDIAALISVLIGIPFPVNSEGIVPLDYLYENETMKSLSILANAKQICSSLIKRELIWKENSYFSVFSESKTEAIQKRLTEIQEMVDKNSTEAQEESLNLVHSCIDGLEDYRESEKEQSMLIFFITITSWILFCFIKALRLDQEAEIEVGSYPKREYKSLTKFGWVAVSISLLVYLWIKNAPPRYYQYAILPIVFLYTVIKHIRKLKEFLPQKRMTLLWILALIYILTRMGKIYYGEKQTLMYMILGWALFALIETRPKLYPALFFLVSVGGLAYMLEFHKLDVIISDQISNSWKVLAALFIIAAPFFKWKGLALVGMSAVIIKYGLMVETIDKVNIQSRVQDNLVYYPYARLTMVIAVAAPFLFKLIFKPSLNLLIIFSLSAISPFVLVQSLAYESAFIAAYASVLMSWKILEESKVKETRHCKERNFVTIVIGFVILYQIGFFGAGNSPSLDTFRLESVWRIFEEFDVQTFGIMVFLKFCVPFFVLNIFFQALFGQEFKNCSRLYGTIAFSTVSSLIIFTYLSTEKKTGLDLKMTVSYPTIIGVIFIANILTSGLANLILWNTGVEKDE